MHVDNFPSNIANLNYSLDVSIKSEGEAGSPCTLQKLPVVCDQRSLVYISPEKKIQDPILGLKQVYLLFQ